MILSGSTVRTDNVHLLATMLQGDELATKLERALANNNTIVALSIADRGRVVAVIANSRLDSRSCACVLVTQLKKHHEREAQVRRVRLIANGFGANVKASGSDARPDSTVAVHEPRSSPPRPAQCAGRNREQTRPPGSAPIR